MMPIETQGGVHSIIEADKRATASRPRACSLSAALDRKGADTEALTAVQYRGNVRCMAIAQSRLTAQGQISVPAAVRRKLGVGPGSTLEWHEEGEKVVVRRVGQFTSADLHEALFSKPPRRRSLAELKEGLKAYAKRRHARR
jgi:AbrB family looped-hinge helix DNA binding protein